jgi:hypothetical protein
MTPLDLIFEREYLLKNSGEKKFKKLGKLFCTLPITFKQKIWGLTRDCFCHSCVIDTAVMKIGDVIVNFLQEFEAIFKNLCIRGLGEVNLCKIPEAENLMSGSL